MTLLKRLLGAALIGFVGFVLYLTLPAWSSMFASTPATFTPENWRDAHPYRREVMAKDFLDRHPYTGMHQDAVIHLLGKPNQQTKGSLHYFVALTAADYMVLTFEIDSNGRISSAYLRQS